jgi:hypothetical protein
MSGDRIGDTALIGIVPRLSCRMLTHPAPDHTTATGVPLLLTSTVITTISGRSPGGRVVRRCRGAFDGSGTVIAVASGISPTRWSGACSVHMTERLGRG